MSDIPKQLRDPSVFLVSRKDTADYIEELEDKLAKAVEALKFYSEVDDDGGWIATKALAELTGDKYD